MIKGLIKEITRQRFDALTFAVLPIANLLFEQIFWYSDSNEDILAVIVLDRSDLDFGCVVLARNEKGVFNAIDCACSFKNISEVKKVLFEKIYEFSSKPEKIHVQIDGKFEQKDIFHRIYTDEKLSRPFILLRDNDGFSAAKRIIQEVAFTFVDCDGMFFKRFQTNEFNQRLWELYLYAYLHEAGFELINDYSSPDYFCTKFGEKIFIEATTINSAEQNPTYDVSSKSILNKKDEKRAREKFLRKLINKLDMRYWNKEHVKGSPVIFAVQSFEDLMNTAPLIDCVYGLTEDHPGQCQTKLKSGRGRGGGNGGFFSFEESVNISAVLFSNSGTIAKFNRMGKLAGFGLDKVKIFRTGLCLELSNNFCQPQSFYFEVRPGVYAESWGQGLGMLHNPNALHPIDPDLFPGVVHYFQKGGQLKYSYDGFFMPIASITLVLQPKRRK